MRFGSVCSGIEAASVAWGPLGWEAQFLSEIEPFPCSVLAHHYPSVPNMGDMTKFKEWPNATLDVLIGGTPCQSYSVAGLRAGLDDPRGNLMLTYVAIARKYRPRWVVWENVPGVLSSNEGRDFGSLLGLLTGRHIDAPPTGWKNSGSIPGHQSAYGIAWRVLDAQYAGVPQRRRRVFVIGYLGDWRRAAGVLFERHSLSGNPPPSRSSRQGTARGIEFGPSGGRSTEINPTLDCRAKDGPIRNQLAGAVLCTEDTCASLTGKPFADRGASDLDKLVPICMAHGQASAEIGIGIGIGTTLNCNHEAPILCQDVAHTLRGEGFDASEDGTGRGTPLVAVPLQEVGKRTGVSTDDPRAGIGIGSDGDPMYTLQAGAQHGIAVAFQERGREGGRTLEIGGDVAYALTAPNGGGRAQERNVAHGSVVRRLTPRECERLQGFPDDYTLIPITKGKRVKWSANGPRYKALGNSMAVPVIRWLGERIEMVEAL